jgi:hypothetical protein
MLNILFKAVSKTLLQFGENHLGGKLGFVAVLHTWDQRLKAHFHLHCLVAGGALCSKSKRWVPCKDNYLFNQEALSLVFRGKFIDHLTRAIRCGKLSLDEPYQQFKNKLYKHNWVVSVRQPIKQAQHVLQYLARYTHRVAIANSRLTALKDGTVSFKHKDRKKNRLKPPVFAPLLTSGLFQNPTLWLFGQPQPNSQCDLYPPFAQIALPVAQNHQLPPKNDVEAHWHRHHSLSLLQQRQHATGCTNTKMQRETPL